MRPINHPTNQGFERVAGALAGGIAEWARAGLPLEHTEQVTVSELDSEISAGSGLAVVDVRRQPEWNQGHLAGALHHPLDRLRETMGSLDRSRPYAVHCKSGYRSLIACSLLEQQGFSRPINVLGGLDAWTAAGLPVVRAGGGAFAAT